MVSVILSIVSAVAITLVTYMVQSSPKHFAIACVIAGLAYLNLFLLIGEGTIQMYRKNVRKSRVCLNKEHILRVVSKTDDNDAVYHLRMVNFYTRVEAITSHNNLAYYNKYEYKITNLINKHYMLYLMHWRKENASNE